MDELKIFNVGKQPDFDIYSKEMGDKRVYTVCGRSTTLDIGDVIEFPGYEKGLRVEGIERRDHRGVFKKPKDKKNSFYTATCKEVIMYDIYEQLKKDKEDGTE